MVDERFTELLMPTLDAFSEMLRTVKPMVKMEDVDDILVADFSSIKNNDARQVIERLYSMSIRANKAIHEVHSVYNDMQLCQLMSRRFPWRKGTFKRSDHLHFSWMLFVNLCYLFRLKLKQAYNVAQPLAALSKGANKFDVASELKLLDHKIGRHIRARGEHWHQWNVGHKWIKDYRMFEFLDQAGELPRGLPPIDGIFRVAQSELVSDVQDAMEAMDTSLETLLKATANDISHGMNLVSNFLKNYAADQQAAE